MYLIFFWVKREKNKQKRKPVCSGRDVAGRRQKHTRVMMPSRSPSWAGLCCLLRGLELPLLGGQEQAHEEAGCRLRELTDLKRQRYVRQQKKHRCIEQSFGLCGRRRGWDDLGEWH